MKRTVIAALLAASCAAVLLPPTASLQAQMADPLIDDSLETLDELIQPANCTIIDAVDGTEGPGGNELPFRFCDDGLPPAGGGHGAIPVPVKYAARAGGNDHSGLRPPASLEEVAAADALDDLRPEEGNRISLDVDVSLPAGDPPAGGRPLLVLVHGCCDEDKSAWESSRIDDSGDRWHQSNAYWAARGYVVLTYTSRGFVDENGRGSTGTSQLFSRRYEVNDLQYLTGLLVDHDARQRDMGEEEVFSVDPKRVGVMGASFGASVAWLALTDPRWNSPASGTSLKLRAVVPRHGPTDVLESLLPGGHYLDRRPATGRAVVAPSRPPRAPSASPVGVLKESIAEDLFAADPGSTRPVLPAWFDSGIDAISDGEPYDGDPAVADLVDRLIGDRSAYFQTGFWKRVKERSRTPVYALAGWTDPLFTAIETVRFANKLQKLDKRYPLGLYLGDFENYTQDKNKEWADLCGKRRRICSTDAYRDEDGKLTLWSAPSRRRSGVNTRVASFIDRALRKGLAPRRKVEGTSTICPANATRRYRAREPGIEYRAGSWRALAPARQLFFMEGAGTIDPGTDSRGPEVDPVFRAGQPDVCYTTADTTAPDGVVQMTSDRVRAPFTMMGMPAVLLDAITLASDPWIEARIFDLSPDGTMTLVGRGPCRIGGEETCEGFELFGGAWRFLRGHRLAIEFSAADAPFLRPSDRTSPISISNVVLKLPVVLETAKRDPR